MSLTHNFFIDSKESSICPDGLAFKILKHILAQIANDFILSLISHKRKHNNDF